MRLSFPSFDSFMTEQFPEVYRLCLLLTASPPDAWQAAFQTFLYVGAMETKQELSADFSTEQEALFYWCMRTCTDYYYRKIRRRPKKAAYEKAAGFSVSDDLWELLGLPFGKKAAVFFICYLGYSPRETQQIIRSRAIPLKSAGFSGPAADRWRGAVASIAVSPDSADQMLASLYMRFEERSVKLENRLRNLRFWWDRAVIWIAAALLILFAAAALYTANLGI